MYNRPSKHRLRNLAVLSTAIVCFILAWREQREWPWRVFQSALRVGFLLLAGLYLISVHTVLNFSAK